MPDEVIHDPQAARKREQTRLRVQRHRAKKVKQAAFVEALEAVAATEDQPKPSRARSKQALLKNVLVKEGVTVNRLVTKKVEALEGTKLRQVGDEVREVPDFATQLRACDALTRDLVAAGEYPSDASGAAPALVVNVLAISQMDAPESLRKHSENMALATGRKIIDALSHEQAESGQA
jgi:hypothetical protein